MDLAVNATDVYVGVTYDTGGAILRVPIGGGESSRVTTLDGSEEALALTRDYVVFAESDPGRIVRMGLDGSDHAVLFSGSIPSSTIFGPLGTLATDGQNVYFAAPDGVQRVPLAGGAATQLTTHTGATALVGSNLVIADTAAEAVYSIPAAGGPVSTLARGLSGDLGPVLSCANALCWGSEVEVPPSEAGTGTLQRFAPGGTPENVADGFYGVYRLLFDGTAFYGTAMDDASTGLLFKLAATAGASVQLAGPGSGLAMDDECLYVADLDTGVYSVAKSTWNATPR